MKKLLSILFALLFLSACEDQSPSARIFPILGITRIIDDGNDGVKFLSEVVQAGTSEISSYGFVWSNFAQSGFGFSNSPKIEVGQGNPPATVEAIVTSGFSSGITYVVRAYTIIEDKIIYGIPQTFVSEGTGNEKWSLVSDGFGEQLNILSAVTVTNGAIRLFNQDRGIYTFDIESETLSRIGMFPRSVNRQPKAISNGDTSYFWEDGSSSIYRLNGTDLIEATRLPFSSRHGTGASIEHVYQGRFYMIAPRGVFSYDFNTDTWSRRGDPPQNDGIIGGASFGQKMYTLYDDGAVYEYDVVSTSSVRLPDFPGVIEEFMPAFATSDKVYMGLSFRDNSVCSCNPGERGAGMDNHFWSYDLESGEWTEEPVFPSANLSTGHIFTFVIDGQFYIARGVFQDSFFELWSFRDN